jgi:hypothetical protein
MTPTVDIIGGAGRIVGDVGGHTAPAVWAAPGSPESWALTGRAQNSQAAKRTGHQGGDSARTRGSSDYRVEQFCVGPVPMSRRPRVFVLKGGK